MFTGFTQDALDFLSDIRFNNNQTFFENNRERYETKVKAPLRALCEELGPVVQLVDSRLDIRPGRTMSRIRRDTRFTKDKSPFRDHVWLGWRYPSESRSEGFGMYWGFGPEWMCWGCGCYAADKPLMDALRLHIRKNPDEVREALSGERIRQDFAFFGESYKKLAVPDDVPQDLRHLYVRKGFGVEHTATQQEWRALHSHEMADILAADLAELAPLQQLMQRMRQQAQHAQEQEAREREAAQREAAKHADAPAKITVRSAEDFEF